MPVCKKPLPANLFASERPKPRSRILTMRVTEAEEALLNEVAASLDRDRSEVIRDALAFWLRLGPSARLVEQAASRILAD